MDSGIRGHAAVIVDQENGVNGAERKRQSVVGCVCEAEGQTDMHEGGRVDCKILTTGGGSGVWESSCHHYTLPSTSPGSLAGSPICPFYPSLFRSAADAGRPGSD